MKKSKVSTTPVGLSSVKSSLKMSTANNTPKQSLKNSTIENSKYDSNNQILNDSHIQKEEKSSINRLPPSINSSQTLSVRNMKNSKLKQS